MAAEYELFGICNYKQEYWIMQITLVMTFVTKDMHALRLD